MNVLEAYAEWSHTYDDDRNLTRDLDEEVTRRTFAGKRYKTILEIGCGTGKNTPLFAQTGASVQAIDFSDLGAIYSKVLVPLVGLPKDGPVERIFDLTQQVVVILVPQLELFIIGREALLLDIQSGFVQ